MPRVGRTCPRRPSLRSLPSTSRGSARTRGPAPGHREPARGGCRPPHPAPNRAVTTRCSSGVRSAVSSNSAPNGAFVEALRIIEQPELLAHRELDDLRRQRRLRPADQLRREHDVEVLGQRVLRHDDVARPRRPLCSVERSARAPIPSSTDSTPSTGPPSASHAGSGGGASYSSRGTRSRRRARRVGNAPSTNVPSAKPTAIVRPSFGPSASADAVNVVARRRRATTRCRPSTDRR